ncbi:helix-turn-helix domain-containing protein [Aeromonas rivipollensis]|uniref:helix-turn-helix domain-containing protein n=1 Tax=Aeromonas rivipollensis TaxID=948519 RepID=UPI0038D16422
MKTATLSHSDQIVATLAKLPLSTFGSPRTKEVMIAIASHMSKAKNWAAWPSVPTIAAKVGCCVRTVRYALRRLEAINFINTKERKRESDPRMNTSSLYTLGAALRSLCERLCRVSSKPVQAKLEQGQKNRKDKDTARSRFFSKQNKTRLASRQPVPLNVPMTAAEAIETARESALRGLAKMRSMLPPELWTVTQGELTSQEVTA